jgi:PPOX class probable F420-dependent enzyme
VKDAVPDWALARLREARVARLGTADAGGRPLVVPVCYVFDGARVYSAIDAKPKRTARLRRLANLEANPQACLVVDEYDEDWNRLWYVIVEGGATILRGGDEYGAAVDRLVGKYPQYRTLALDRESGTLIRIAASRIVPWRFRPGAV